MSLYEQAGIKKLGKENSVTSGRLSSLLVECFNIALLKLCLCIKAVFLELWYVYNNKVILEVTVRDILVLNGRKQLKMNKTGKEN